MSNPTVFYTLPASDLEPGLSTADGQYILSVDSDGDAVLYTVATPGYDDTETRIAPVDERVELAEFEDD